MIGIADPFSESPGESVARLVVRASGLPAPVTQYRYEDREEGRRYYIDLAWPQLRIAIEFDGFMKYVSPEDLRAEKRRSGGSCACAEGDGRCSGSSGRTCDSPIS